MVRLINAMLTVASAKNIILCAKIKDAIPQRDMSTSMNSVAVRTLICCAASLMS